MGKDRLNNMGDGTHLDLSRRKVITRLLEDNKTAKDIGMIIGLDPTNVSREIKKRRIKKDVASLNIRFVKIANIDMDAMLDSNVEETKENANGDA